MNLRSKTYRLFSALMLMLFISSMVLPGAVSAASLWCDMSKSQMHHSQPADECCDQMAVEDFKGDHQRPGTNSDHCNSEQICLHTLSPEQSDVPALVIKQIHTPALLTVADEGRTDIEHNSKFRVLDSSFNFLTNPPPLFLLNSSFLN